MKNKILSTLLAVLLVLSAIPFVASAATPVAYAMKTYAGQKLSGFEPPYDPSGNYTLRGFTISNATFDGEEVKAIERTGDVDAYREKDGTFMSSFSANMYNYGLTTADDGTKLKVNEASYIAIDYYYDTTGRDLSTEGEPQSLTGLKMAWTQHNLAKTSSGNNDQSVNWTRQSTQGIIENEWDTLVIDFAAANSEQFESFKDYYIRQYKFFPMGNGQCPKMYKGDKLYIKGLTFYSYDPSNPPEDQRLIAIFVDDVLWDGGYEELYDLAEYTFPEYTGDFPEGALEFRGYKDQDDDVVYQPGEKYVLNRGIDGMFDAIFSRAMAVNFKNNGEIVDTINCKSGDTITLPAAVAAPEGKIFTGWNDGLNTYPANSKYVVNSDELEFTAKFAEPATAYVCADGVIAGVDTVYSSLVDADAAIKAAGGIGKIFIAGSYVCGSPVNLTSSQLTIEGFDGDAALELCTDKGSGNPFIMNGTLVIDNIIIRRSTGTNDENWISFRGTDATFGPGCTYESGIRTTNSAVMHLYHAVNGGTTLSNTSVLNINAPLQFAIFSTIGGWSGGISVTGSFDFTFNDGTYNNLFMGSRNGNGAGNKSTLNGDVSYTLNGGKFSNFVVGSHRPTDINGTIFATVNGGEITKLVVGDEGRLNTPNDTIASKIKNLVLVINGKDYLDYGNAAFPAITVAKKTNGSNKVLVLNNAELGDSLSVDASALAMDNGEGNVYIVNVMYGNAQPVVDGTTVKFALTPDDPDKDTAYVNGAVLVKDSEGLYTLPACGEGIAEQDITFAKAGAASYTVSYTDGVETVTIGSFGEGDKVALPACKLTKENSAFESYDYNGVAYPAGSLLTVPAENVVLGINWFKNDENKYYVASTGSDTNGGFKADIPFATIAKAQAAIGEGNTGIVVIMDTLKEFPNVEMAGHFTFTGKDGDKIYENAAITRVAAGKRYTVNNGWFTLDHLKAINPPKPENPDECNTPYQVASGTLEFGEGYVIQTSKGVKIFGDEMRPTGATGDKTIIINNKSQFIDLLDWGNNTIGGTLRIIVNENGSFSNAGNQISIGGDSGSACTATVQNPMFVEINNNMNGVQVKRGGFKTSSNTVINGLMVTMVNSNAQVVDATTGSYTNNGKEYIVNAPATPEGCSVKEAGFGKIMITAGEGLKVQIEDANGKRIVDDISSAITLAEGNTTVSFVSDAVITIKYDGVFSSEENGASNYTVLDKSDDDYIVSYYTYNGEKYFPNDVITLPAVDTTIDFVSFKVSKDNPIVYIDPVNGNDANSGFAEDSAFRTFAAASSALASFDNATLNIIGTLNANSFSFPALSGTLTVQGGKLIAAEAIDFKCDAVLKNIEVALTNAWKQIGTNGFDFTADENVKVAAENNSSSNGILTIHAGKAGSSMTGDMNITLKSGNWTVQAGPYYLGSDDKTYTGNITVVVDGADVQLVRSGDGYNPVNKSFTMDGDFMVYVNSGSLKQFTPFNFIANGEEVDAICYNYTAEGATEGKGGYTFNFHDGLEGTFAAGVLTLTSDELCHVVETGEEFTKTLAITDYGTFTIEKGAGRKTTDKLTVEGASIRVTGTQGLRFMADYDLALDTEYAVTEFGFFVLPTTILGGADIEAGKTYTYNSVDYTAEKVVAEKLYEKPSDTMKKYTLVITEIADTNYTREYTAVPYILVDGEYIYGEAYSTSIYAIAKAAVGDATGDLKTTCESIISTVEG